MLLIERADRVEKNALGSNTNSINVTIRKVWSFSLRLRPLYLRSLFLTEDIDYNLWELDLLMIYPLCLQQG